MNIGICSWAFAGIARGARAATEVSAEAARWGFAYFEGAFGSRGQLAPGQPVVELPGAPLTSLGTLELHRFHLTDPRSERRQRAAEVVSEMIDCAQRWRVSSVSFSPGAVQVAGAPGTPVCPAVLDEAVDRACAALQPLLARARAAGVALALENLPFHALSTRRAMRRALACLPGARVCLDLGNATLDGPVSAWIEEFEPRIEKLHVSDARVDAGFELVLPAAGSVPWQELRPALARLGRPVFVEALLPAGEDEAAFLARVRSATEKAMAA